MSNSFRTLAIAATFTLLVPVALNAWWGGIHLLAGFIGGALVSGVDEVDKDIREDGGEVDPESSEEIGEAKQQMGLFIVGGVAMGLLACLQIATMTMLLMGVGKVFNAAVGGLTIVAAAGWLTWIDDVHLSFWVLVSFGAGALTIAAALATPPPQRRHVYPPGYPG